MLLVTCRSRALFGGVDAREQKVQGVFKFNARSIYGGPTISKE